MVTAPNRLNKQALTLEQAQGLIRIAVKNALFGSAPKHKLDNEVKLIISRALKNISIPSLKEAAYKSLIQFYHEQRRLAAQIPQRNLLIFLALTRLRDKDKGVLSPDSLAANMPVKTARSIIRDNLPPDEADEIITLGQPLQMYHERYAKEHVIPTLKRMAEAEALDPDSGLYTSKRSTLRARAEIEVRYQGHQDALTDFKERGVKLVIISSHSDCSVRCRPYQGRVFSLDGSKGTTPDGRKYYPLEEAINDEWNENPEKKSGKWKNGLFGFNCRHYMVEYRDGYEFPKNTRKTEEKQYYISQRQRALERNVRHWVAKAESYKGTNLDAYKEAKKKAADWNNRYIAFSKKHDRPYYASRTRLI